MATISSPSLLNFSDENEKLDLKSIWALVISINQHIDELIQDKKAWKSLKMKCNSEFKIQKKQEFFEFSEQSVLSNLYWGIESLEAAIRAKCEGDKTTKLENSEKMLQVPALLNEDGFTSGIANHYLVCCSYFYLAVIRKVENNEHQVAMHFLQALLVSPRFICNEFASELCGSLFLSCILSKRQVPDSRRISTLAFKDFANDENNEEMRRMARKYRAWLMYYEVMSYGEVTKWNCGYKEIWSTDDELQHFSLIKQNSYMNADMKSSSTASSHLYKRGHSWPNSHYFEKVHPFNPQENITHEVQEEPIASKDIPNIQNHITKFTNFDQICGEDSTKSLNIKLVKDILKDSQSDTPTSIHSCNSNSTEDIFSEEFRDTESSSRTIRTTKNYQAPFSISNPDSAILMTRSPSHLMYKEINDVTKLFSRRFSSSYSEVENSKNINEVCLHAEENANTEQGRILEKIISKLYFSEGLGKCETDYTVEITEVYEMLNHRTGIKYSLLKDIILDQLITAISTSKEERVLRESVSILSIIVSRNKSVIDDMKKKGFRLCDLESALKRNVFEAAILIYLINPSPAEIKNLGLLPILLEIVCTSNSYNFWLTELRLTPSAASLMIIEGLVTAFDSETNNMNLAAISSPEVLSRLLEIARINKIEELIAFAAIAVKCMRFDGECRKYISQFMPVAPFVSLLRSNQTRAASIALEFFHEILRLPRSSAISLLQQIQNEGGINIMCVLLLLIQQSQPEYKLLAANLLLQLDTLEDSSGKTIYREEAMQALLEAVTSEENLGTKQLSAFILSNIGGTYSWTGEPYTIAWLVKKTGLTSMHQRNIIKNFDWSDQCLQDADTDAWCNKVARRVMKYGNRLFRALEMGLKSQSKRVSRDCLTAIAWVGCEIVKSPNDLRNYACEILLSTIEEYLHPGMELEDRFLACFCIYNYTSGKGMQKLIHFSEGVRESLRRLSNITWMAEELLRVADYFQPNKWRISCVHTQFMEASHNNYSGAVSALIYYKGQLYSGHTDGSIKVWDMKGQTATLVRDMKEHKKAVTCFSLFEPGSCLLSGSADKTIRIWQMINWKLECIEVIATKESIQSMDTYGDLIFTITQSHEMKVFDSSRKCRHLFKNKHVKCMKVMKGKVYVGCMDSSIQELVITNNRQQEIKAPLKSWRMQSRPINSISVYRDWLYIASTIVEGSNIKDWKRNSKPLTSIVPEKGSNVLAMEVVEDFIYLKCKSSMNILQIWLRGTQHKVGRISAGSKITSVITANDMVLCGTETGLIKGWIPL